MATRTSYGRAAPCSRGRRVRSSYGGQPPIAEGGGGQINVPDTIRKFNIRGIFQSTLPTLMPFPANRMKLVIAFFLQMVLSSCRSRLPQHDHANRHPEKQAVSVGGDVKGICCNGECYRWNMTCLNACRTTLHHAFSLDTAECHLSK